MSKMDLLWKRAVFPVLLVLLLSAVGLTNAMAQSFTVGNLNYSLNDVSRSGVGQSENTTN